MITIKRSKFTYKLDDLINIHYVVFIYKVNKQYREFSFDNNIVIYTDVFLTLLENPKEW